MARRLTCQLYSNVAGKNWKWSTFCVALFWKQIWGLMECWRAHSHAKIHWQAKQHIESHGARERERKRGRENSIFPQAFKLQMFLAALRERLGYQSALLILSASTRNLCCKADTETHNLWGKLFLTLSSSFITAGAIRKEKSILNCLWR